MAGAVGDVSGVLVAGVAPGVSGVGETTAVEEGRAVAVGGGPGVTAGGKSSGSSGDGAGGGGVYGGSAARSLELALTVSLLAGPATSIQIGPRLNATSSPEES